MSIHVMSAVYQARLGSTTRKAILLKMADHSNDDGGSIYVGVDRISRETEVADRTVQRALREFEAEGLLVVEKAGGNGPRSTTHYRIDLQRLSALPRASDPKRDNKSSKRKATKGDTASPLPKASRATLATAKGDTDDEKGDTVSPEPSITIRKEPSDLCPKSSAGDQPPGSPPTAATSRKGPPKNEEVEPSAKLKRSYPDDFEQFWQDYPDVRNNSKANDFYEWRRLPVDARKAATESIPAFTAYCQANPDYRVVHAERFLKSRRFEGYAEETLRYRKSGLRPGWWEDKINSAPNLPFEWWECVIGDYASDMWPVRYLGPGPWDGACLVPPQVRAKLNLAERYPHGTGA